MILALCDSDVLRLEKVFSGVRVRDGLQMYVELLKEEARVSFRHAQRLYAQGALKREPSLPDVLRPHHAVRRRRSDPSAFVAPEKPTWVEKLEMADDETEA